MTSKRVRSANVAESRFLEQLDAWILPEGTAGDFSQWQDATPGFRLQAWQSGRLKIDVACGATSLIYDWASLTKIVFSTTSAMIEVDQGDLSLRDAVADWLPETLGEAVPKKRAAEFKSVLVRDLLRHSAGMTWWKPFFKTISAKAPRDHEEAWALLSDLVAKDVRARLTNGEIAKARKGPAVYSDLDFFLLGEILRRSSLMSLPEQYARVQDRLGLDHTYFHALAKADVQSGVILAGDRRPDAAATERDPWRGRILKSEVHDENAASLKGIAPHAGLFGPIEDLSRYGLQLRKLARGERSKLPASAATFLKRSVPRARGDWALGFMMPTLGSASCGPRFSRESLGHTGFTGTSLWYDPKLDLLVTVLSNRVHPTRANSRFVRLRPALHTFVVNALKF
jgi:serine-type D-Ala-D-Ala carboxypeptidase